MNFLIPALLLFWTPLQEPLRLFAEGRTAAAVPGGEGGRIYERRRLKRTVALEPTTDLASRWDRLYEGGGGIQAAYCNWDDEYLYLAVETAEAAEVRLDLDGAGDGWFHGADNLSLRISPPADGSPAPLLEARRFDTVQNRDRPVWAAAPIPASAIRAVAGSGGGGYAVSLAIPRSELFGLRRQPGVEFGLRIEAGPGAASDADARAVTLQPFLRLELAERSEAAAGGLSVRVAILGGTRRVVGQPLRVHLEARNGSKSPVALRRFFVAGAQGTAALLDSASFPAETLKPGARWRRETRLALSPAAGLGAFVVRGGVERDDGATVAALASFDQIDPFEVRIDLDERTVRIKDPIGPLRRRLLSVTVRNRGEGRHTAALRLALPAGWAVEGGRTEATVKLSFASEVKGASFQVLVPPETAPGEYPIGATVEVEGRTYQVEATLRVVAD